ncbi:nitronate monooxygenase [Mucilaginibacter gossypii]|uniref:NAD(P)H-dependent flavin oxidoreductase n=1 Tax=Mucilaginibacter gossypii TaxID=551996 RepID=UPI000DCE67B8|nr:MULTISPECIES: nitronate monooxygenase [Mucilaginibacter]QTE35775.1 nitronate monooxygenase [Mucilaginibacter gossypii]RAV56866.1 nitronate monooxygenase [Mucilaginibacter rubeus]
MWYNTKATELLGIDYPILQGPFGGNLSSVELVAAVSNAGGLGGYGAYTLSAPEIAAVDKQIKAATNKPYNINIWVSETDALDGAATDAQYEHATQLFKPYFDEAGIPLPPKPDPFKLRFENQLQVILDLRPKVFSFMFGTLPADVMEQCRKLGIVTVGAATTLDEAIALEASGVDLIIASGFEAGGHRPSFLAPAESSTTGTFVLLQLIKEKVKVPVIAAGGIANGRGVAGALTLGADAVQIGTAFLAVDESGALPIHRQMLFSDAAKYTTLSRAFTGRLGRGITSRVAKDLAGKEAEFLPFPLQTTFMSPLRKAALEQQKWDMILFWGGQIAPILKHTNATALMQSLIEDTTKIMNP